MGEAAALAPPGPPHTDNRLLWCRANDNDMGRGGTSRFAGPSRRQTTGGRSGGPS